MAVEIINVFMRCGGVTPSSLGITLRCLSISIGCGANFYYNNGNFLRVAKVATRFID